MRRTLPWGRQVAVAALALLASGGLRAAGFTVSINEVHYHPADDTRTGEFVEIHNYGSEDADLGGWLLTGGIQFLFPRGTILPAGGYLLVAWDPAALAARYGLHPSLVAGPTTGSLSNGGESLRLLTSQSYLISFVDYLDSDPFPEAPDGLGPSLERVSPFSEDADARGWAASTVVGGTPGARNSVTPEGLEDPGAGQPIIPEGATWRFFRGRSEPPAGWAEIGFDASSWEEGPAGFGYQGGDDATVLDDMQGAYTTVYVRREFTIEEPALVEALTFTVSFDDGYVAYLNGVEIGRASAPGPPGSFVPFDAVATQFTTPALVDQLAVSPGLLVSGTNGLAVLGLNGSITSGDFSLHPSLSGRFTEDGRVRLVAVGEIWKFLRGTAAPPPGWAGPGFDDSGWEEGATGLGYGDGDDATVLGDMRGSYLTVFARKSFAVADPSRVTSLVLQVDYDDGFIAYLNGVEVARANASVPGFDAPADSAHEAGTPGAFAIADPASRLVEGANILALEGHNATLGSSDFSLSPALDAAFEVADPPPGSQPPASRDLVINEVFPGGPGTGWVELFNPTAAPVDGSGRRLQLFPAPLGDWSLPAGSTVPAGGWLLVSEADLDFELESVPALILATADGRFIDALNPRTTGAGHSTGRYPDGADNRFVFTVPSPEGPNVLELDERVVIHEIMYHPADTNPAGEWLELANLSGEPANLAGWSFTRGIDYTFLPGAVIPPRGFLVIAKDPAAVETYYGISGVLGPFTGGLRNDAETVLLRDALNNPADRVRYADEDSWPEAPDGTGPSLELVHRALENRYGPAWAASSGEGTPGAPNSRVLADPPPVVAGVEHLPVVPGASGAVRVQAAVSDETAVAAVTLFWEIDSGGPSGQVPMADDGISDDGVSANGIYGGEIPPQADRSVVAFWIRAQDATGQSVTVPAGAPRPAFLYQVDDDPGGDDVRPLYRIVMRASDLNQLRTRDPLSDVLLDLTFVADGRAWHNRGIRYRGRSARSCTPRSYRIQFSHDHDFHGIKRLNMNGCITWRQAIGLDFLTRVGLPTSRHWFRRLAFNGVRDSGIHLRVESIDEQFLERSFPDDGGGNLYRGEQQANLDYRGESFDLYRPHYLKRSNEEEDDFSDVVDLCRRFDPTLTPDEEFPAALEEAADVNEWALYFAAFAVLGSIEGALVRDRGDDYFLYHRPSDGRWLLVPWDLDGSFAEADQRLFRPTVDAIERFLEHPRYAPDYWCHLEWLLASGFAPDVIEERIDLLRPLFSQGNIDTLRSYLPARRSYISQRLNPNLDATIEAGAVVCDGVIHPSAPEVQLSGMAPGCLTTEVLVNGTLAAYDPQTNEWQGSADLNGASQLVVMTRYRTGTEIERLSLPVSDPAAASVLPARIDGVLFLTRDASPYAASGDVTVQAGATLRIEPGVTVRFPPEATLFVAGTLIAEGTESEPIVFRPEICTDQWEGVAFLAGSTRNVLSSCELRLATRAEGYLAGLAADGAEVAVRSVSFVAPAATAVEVRAGGHAEIEELRLEASGAGAPGVLFENATGGVRRSWFRGWSGPAVTLVGAEASVEWSVFEDCDAAVRIEDGARGTLAHLTVHGGQAGLELDAGSGGRPASATADSLIVWAVPEVVRSGPGSTIDLSFSDTWGGVWPGAGNISEDPLFVDPAGGDFRLRSASPCRASGRDGEDMGALPFTPLGEIQRFLRCDGNGDGRVDISDGVSTLLRLFRGAPAGPCEAARDCDATGGATVTDVIFSFNHLFRRGPLPPAPYPDCDEAPDFECLFSTCLR